MPILLLNAGQIIWPLFGLAVFGLGIYAIVNVMQRKDLSETVRLRWMVGIVMVPILGPIFYLLRGRQGK